jgi:hypothetical protein
MCAIILATLLASLFLPSSREAHQWQEKLDDEELYLLLGVFYWFIFLVKLQ